MKILVIGSAGFIGNRLSRQLVVAGHSVTCVDLIPTFIRGATCVTKEAGTFLIEQNTLNSFPTLKGMLNNDGPVYDAIVHLVSSARSMNYSPENIIANELHTTLQVLSYARLNPHTKIVYASNAAVKYDDRNDMITVAKELGERLVRQYIDSYGANASILRMFSVFGPDEMDNGSKSSFIKKCKNAVLSDSRIVIHGDGRQQRDFVHIDDVVDAISQVLIMPNNLSLYEIGTAKTRSINSIATQFADATGVEIVSDTHTSDTLHITQADPALWPPGWTPKRALDEHLQEWIDYYRQDRLLNSITS